MRAMEKPLIALVLLGVAWGTIPADEQKKEDAPVVYTNKDLPKVEGTSRPPASTSPDPVELPTYDAIRDRNGHGEAWWRQRACELDAQIVVAEDEAQRLLVRSKRHGVLVDPTVATRAKEAADRLIELRAERAGLPRELTEAGGLSSWLYGEISCVEAAVLAAPETEPADLAEGLALSWKSLTPGARYVVEVQCLDCCGMTAPCDVRSIEANGTSLRLPFDAGRSGRWRVRAIDPSGSVGAWSEWQSFSRP